MILEHVEPVDIYREYFAAARIRYGKDVVEDFDYDKFISRAESYAVDQGYELVGDHWYHAVDVELNSLLMCGEEPGGEVLTW